MTDWLMTSDKCNSIIAKATGLISSLFNVTSSRDVLFCQPQQLHCHIGDDWQYAHYGFGARLSAKLEGTLLTLLGMLKWSLFGGGHCLGWQLNTLTLQSFAWASVKALFQFLTCDIAMIFQFRFGLWPLTWFELVPMTIDFDPWNPLDSIQTVILGMFLLYFSKMEVITVQTWLLHARKWPVQYFDDQ